MFPPRSWLLACLALLGTSGLARAQDRELSGPAAREDNGVINLVEGQTTIIHLKPDGSLVKKGDLVCELDPSAMIKKLGDQRIATLGAEAGYQNARLTREVAEIAVNEFVEADRRRELVPVNERIALADSDRKRAEERLEWLDRMPLKGQAEQLLSRIHGKIAFAEEELKRAYEQLEWSNRLLERGYVTRAQNETDRLEVKRMEFALTTAKVLEWFIKDKTLKELQSEVEKARSDELARRQAWEREKNNEARLETQIERCKVLAPASGRLRYAREVVEDSTVREGQLLFRIIPEDER